MDSDLKWLFETFEEASKQFLLMARELISNNALRAEHGAIEETLEKQGAELCRKMLQTHLNYRAEQESCNRHTSIVGSDRVVRPHRRNGCVRQLETIFGGVEVNRVGYSRSSANVESLYPEDAKLNLSDDKYSDVLRRRVALEASKISFDETAKSISDTTAGHVGKRQCEELIVKVAQDFDCFYESRSVATSENTDELLVLTTDGKGIVMHPEDLREETAKAAKQKTNKCKTRLSPGEKKQRKRMATVASVYSVARFERAPEQVIGENRMAMEPPCVNNKRVWASIQREPKEVISDMFAEAMGRDPKRERAWIVLVDGQPHQLSLIKKEAKLRGVKPTIILDFVHVLEYLWKASFCFNASGTQEAEAWVSERALKILQGKSSAVAAGMRRSATLHNLAKEQRANVDKCADYLLKYRDNLSYDKYLEKGYPIATGVIEGACRHLINDRMDITGARWRLERAEAVLRIRSLRSSGNFDEYWKYHKKQELQRNYLNKFLDTELLLAA